MTISDLRLTIDDLDDRIIQLLNERARVAQQIGSLKKQEGLNVLDSDREAAVLNDRMRRNPGPLRGEQIRAIFEKIIASCREMQS